jgi:hypothetical protein
MKNRKSIYVAGMMLMLVVLASSLPAFGQNCALCYTQAASSGTRMIQALKSGILVLIAPPTLMSLGLVLVCYRKRNKTRKDSGELDWQDQSSEFEKW